MGLEFSPVVKKAISEAVADELRLRILRGDVAIGDRLPPERELAAGFGTNRNTLREAIRSLEGQGLVTVRQGDGVRVTDFRRSGEMSILPDLIQVADPEERHAILSDVLRLRRKMAVEVVTMAATEAGSAAESTLRELVARARAADGDLLQTLTIDMELFEAMVDATGSVAARLLFHAMSRLSMACLQRVPELLFVHPDYLRDMPAAVDAIIAGDAPGAAAALEGLFEKTDRVLLDRIAPGA